MYYVAKIDDKIRFPPSYLTMKKETAVKKIIQEKYERRINKELGLVLTIGEVGVKGEGKIIPGDGAIYYNVNFEALLFKPQINEVYASDIKEIVDFGAFASIGPIDGLIHLSQIGQEKYFYDKKAKKLTSKRGKSLGKGEMVIAKISTVSIKETTSDTKIGLTMRGPGLGSFKEKKREKK
ncbi:DNA-directed RNA polymerase [Candidatus Micrarchaeota archaeon]|nr:DNA-directed RNA polymerase [Candidatus Micrarchaeota archaeon]